MKKEIIFHLDEEIVYLLKKLNKQYFTILEDHINDNVWKSVCEETKMTKEQLMNQIKEVLKK